MLRASPALSFVAAAALATLSGCTIYTYQNPPPQPRPRAAAPAPRPATPAATSHPTHGPILAQRLNPAAVGEATHPGPDRAPRITSPIIFGNGQGGLFRGEAFVIPPNSKTLPDLGTLVPFATLFIDRFDIAPQDFSGGFPGALRQDEWFAIRYEGTLTVETAGPFMFELASDDGTILSIDDKKLIDNDGVHGVVGKTANIDLGVGPHRFRLDYFQGNKGPVALRVGLLERGGRLVDNPFRPQR
ncbi:MAG: PA14 domain-containing protein [Byssovorax sp.]